MHCHMDGTVDAKWLIENSFNEASADIWLTSTKPLTTIESLYEAKIRFRHLPSKPDNEHDEGQERITAGHTLYTSAYRPNTWVPLADVRAAFPHPDVYDPVPANLDAAELPSTGKTPSEKAFDHYIHSLMTLTPVPARFATPIKTSKQAWTKFTDTFGVIDGLFGYEPMLKRYFVESFKTLASDGVSYVEARVNFWIRQYSTSDGRLDLAHPSWVRIFQEALAEVKSEPGLEFWDAKIIYSTIRFMPNEELRWHVDNALALKQQFPDTIVGFDLVGWEDVGVTLHAYLPELLRMKRRCRELAIDLPFVLHAGETLADGDAIDDNVSRIQSSHSLLSIDPFFVLPTKLYDAILLGTKRIGHGYSLIKHPLLVDMVKSRQICVESCPISNEILRYTANTSVHPVLSLLARNVPVAISNDDPCQFGNPGLTPDFYQLISASDNLTLSSLAVLAKGSIDHFLVSEGEKERCRKKWEQQWSAFLAGVLAQQS